MLRPVRFYAIIPWQDIPAWQCLMDSLDCLLEPEARLGFGLTCQRPSRRWLSAIQLPCWLLHIQHSGNPRYKDGI